MSKLPKKSRDKFCKTIGDHRTYISRITKTLYYGKFPKNERLSLPVTELAAELFSEAQRGRSLNRLHCDDAARISWNACISPCSLVLAILYLERLKRINPEYLEKAAPSELFLVSLMVSCKFLYDDGEADEVFMDEWAASGGISVKQLVHLEWDFLKAIDWEIYVNQLTFWKKLSEVEKTVAKKQGALRGFFTYTELNTLLATVELHNLVQCIAAVTAILLATYAAALFTLLGSVFIVSYIPGTAIQPKRIDNQIHTVLPILHDSISELDSLEETVLTEIDQMKSNLKGEVKALNVLKTGIFLASIEGFLKPFCSNSNQTDLSIDDDVGSQNVSWDWWTVPTMTWLSETSKLIEKFELPTFSNLGLIGYYLETSVAKTKQLDLEDQIHKASKTRIQDQMENSWHKEWTDTIDLKFYDRYFHYYLENIKS